MIIYFIRHGFPDYSLDVLTEKGRQEAKETHEVLKNIKFDKIYVSTLGRALETARIVTGKKDEDFIKCDWAREDLASKYFAYTYKKQWNWLFWNNKFLSRAKKDQFSEEFFNDPYIKKTRVKEGMKLVNKNVDNWLSSMNIKFNRKTNSVTATGATPDTVALIAHGGFGIAFLASILNIPYQAVALHFYHLDCVGVTVIDLDTNNYHSSRVIRYNSTFYKKEG